MQGVSELFVAAVSRPLNMREPRRIYRNARTKTPSIRFKVANYFFIYARGL